MPLPSLDSIRPNPASTPVAPGTEAPAALAAAHSDETPTCTGSRMGRVGCMAPEHTPAVPRHFARALTDERGHVPMGPSSSGTPMNGSRGPNGGWSGDPLGAPVTRVGRRRWPSLFGHALDRELLWHKVCLEASP